MPALDEWVLRTAAEDLASLHRRIGNGAPAQVNVNLSAATLADRFDHLVESALTHGGLEPTQLRLELPEDADLRAITTATPQLERLRELGVRLTLDDMGAGSTNLRFLSALSIHGIKIDRLFVAGMLNNPRDHAVVKLLTDLGHGLGMWVTAEGVETAAQLTELAQLGVAYAQGYHLGAPMPLPDLTHHLSAPNATVAADARDLRSPLGQWPQPWQARIVPGPATPSQRVTLGRRAEPTDLG
jgi:EAL domain-containing protein (putative c-di-GMP-specific phosphodiesterase class I)